MAESGHENRLPIPLSERFDRYRVEIQKIVERGIEHPRYELKRAVTVSSVETHGDAKLALGGLDGLNAHY
jgi:hypothetical protein